MTCPSQIHRDGKMRVDRYHKAGTALRSAVPNARTRGRLASNKLGLKPAFKSLRRGRAKLLF